MMIFFAEFLYICDHCTEKIGSFK